MEPACPECGAERESCRQCLDQMLAWEWEHREYFRVHHLMVLCYHLQHPSLYSPAGLKVAVHTLSKFLDNELTPEQVRLRKNPKVKLTGTPTSFGRYEHPIRWTITAADVVSRGVEAYCDSVTAWAQSVHREIRKSNPFTVVRASPS